MRMWLKNQSESYNLLFLQDDSTPELRFLKIYN